MKRHLGGFASACALSVALAAPVAADAWIRDGEAFDGVADFDQALRDPEHPTQMVPIYDCGDGLHPSDLGYNKMGDAIDLSLFE